MMMVKKLPLGIQTFREIRESDYVYADKTYFIYNLINSAKYYFLSRPRRFGKSLLLDTIAEAFSGDKELFKGLFLYDSGFDFEAHPVLRIDMSRMLSKTPETLESSLSIALTQRANEEGLDIAAAGCAPSDIFHYLINALYTKYNQRVVVLIDEYDKPILDHLDDIEAAKANRVVLKSFYGILKSMDPYLRMTFITGVTKFTKTSIFSELNNLLDITLTEKYANICGIAVEDLGKYFGEHMERLAVLERFKRSDSLREDILAWYDGYSWNGRTRVINPFSLLSFFMQERFSGFWYASGTPKFLMDLIKKDPDVYTSLKNLKITELMLDSAELDQIEAEPLLFQSGYLTVKEIILTGGSDIYRLDMPNFEVREAFNLHVVSALTEGGQHRVNQVQMEMRDAFLNYDLQKVLDLLKGLFSSIPYQLHINREAYYHSIFLALMNVLGFDTYAEVQTARGRIDAILELTDKVYIIEFKYKDCAPDLDPEAKRKLFEEALDDGINQIKDRGYHNKYAGSSKAVHQVAFAFLGRDNIDMRADTL